MSWLGLGVYVLGLIGYGGTLRRLGVSPYLSWITAMLFQIVVLYGCAMVGILNMGIQWVTYAGIAQLVLWTVLSFWRKAQLQFEGIHLFDFWMITLGLAMGQVLYHSPLVHYDNFSHWAVMVKFMFFSGRLPGAADKLISFTSYPPATALYITQVLHWTGFSEGAMLLAQFALIWAAAYSVFAVLRDRTRALMGMLLCLTIAISFVFNIAIRLNNLLVDYVLPILAVAAIAGIWAYRKRPWVLSGHVALFVAALLLVKNSATFFVVVIGVYFLVTLIQNNREHWYVATLRIPVQAALTLGLAAIPFLIWNWHVKTTFTVSKHEISSQAYANQLSGESAKTILKIFHKFLDQIMSLGSLSTQGILLINVILIGAWVMIRFGSQQKNRLLWVAVMLDVIFLLYYGSLFGMYILSMPYAEAILLDGFERYMGSTVILNLYIGAMFLVRAMDGAMYEQNFQKRDSRSFATIVTKNAYQIGTLIVGFFAITMMYSEITGTKFTNEMNHNTLPLQLQRDSKPWTHLNHKKILVVDPHAGDVADYYAGYAARYYYFTDKAVGQEDFMVTPAVFKQTVQSYQYVVIPEYHRTFTKLTKRVYHQKIKTGLFKIHKHYLQRMH
ncbi:ABC transporter permease [Levilactobacillus fujinensis]|uniref:ABC transporter permease n=1 Tax=Levilactobacillus fujinensis TaxID=2486024 RepID=A0ABW1THL4_9LACO|nr:ABC transporter permease [Levilactobacillus fujinensis]